MIQEIRDSGICALRLSQCVCVCAAVSMCVCCLRFVGMCEGADFAISIHT